MNFTASLLSPVWLVIGWIITVIAVLLALARLPRLGTHAAAVNSWCGITLLVLLFWLLQGGISPGLHYHMSGMTLLMLTMGLHRSMIAAMMVLFLTTAYGLGDWPALGINYVIMVLVPILLSYTVLWLTNHYLPPHLFIYLFVNCFLTGGLSLIMSALSGLTILGLNGTYPVDFLVNDSLPFYFLLSWSEAFTSGLIMTVLVIYRPQSVVTFDDTRFLGKP